MGKIFYILGKSCTGKDTIYKRILTNQELSLQTIVTYTTRPIRAGEMEGQEYHFVNENEYKRLEAADKIIEERAYHTIHGLWRYFTVNDEQFLGMKEKDKKDQNYLMIGVLQSFLSTREYFGKDMVIPIFIDLDDGIRLQRALDRERVQDEPKYAELCRRFLADSEDFAEENIDQSGIDRRFYNQELEQCISEITDYIKEKM